MTRHIRSSLALALALFLAALALSACGTYTLRSEPLDPPMALPDFTLTDQTGQSFRLSDQRGRVVLLFFGYTSCPDVCPTTLADLAAVKRELGTDAAQLQVVFVTVDPERDTQEVIRDYLAKFDPAFIGLHGSQEQLAQVYKAYGVTAIVPEHIAAARVHVVDHSPYVYVIDRQGRLRELLDPSDKLEDIVSDVRYLIHE
ncbi:MAG: electron transporter SenC [Herpetosiphonaceae bacterium]|nr:MAG: electron transporter SenC [Herpetosiphonaceae bacterium]